MNRMPPVNLQYRGIDAIIAAIKEKAPNATIVVRDGILIVGSSPGWDCPHCGTFRDKDEFDRCPACAVLIGDARRRWNEDMAAWGRDRRLLDMPTAGVVH